VAPALSSLEKSIEGKTRKNEEGKYLGDEWKGGGKMACGTWGGHSLTENVGPEPEIGSDSQGYFLQKRGLGGGRR